MKGNKETKSHNILSDKDKIKISLSKNSIQVLNKRYLKKDDSGNTVESPSELFRRVSKAIAGADLRYDTKIDIKELENTFFDMMVNLEFLPNSPTLMNAGRELGQLAACFVLPVEDSMESIFETLKNTALIHKSGGGTGFDFSDLRPKNSLVGSTKGVSSGPVSFMKVFDSATEAIKQGGTRRGANMGILRVDHPDIIEFIECKKDHVTLNNFNISVALTDSFMEALEANENYDLIDPKTKKILSTLKASDVFNKIVDLAWLNGDPGIVFIDRMNRDNPTPKIGNIASTNPCGEQPLLPYEACNLGSINLTTMIKNKKINYKKLKVTVHNAVHFLDNVIDINKYPITEIANMTRSNRKIGLGIMGFADMLIELGIPYNSEEGLSMAEKIMKFVLDNAEEKTKHLATLKGGFDNFKGSTYDQLDEEPRRNATTTTLAPTGTLSIIAGCSSGIEPLFAVSYIRNVMDNDKLIEVNSIFESMAKERGFYSEELMQKISDQGGIQKIEEIPEDIRKVFVTSHDISPEYHINMQAAFQKYTDNAVSKTINFSHNATKEDIKAAYLFSYKSGCKGITIYRDGSRDGQVLSTGKNDSNQSVVESVRPNNIVYTCAPKRPKEMPCEIHQISIKGEMWTVLVGLLDGFSYEIFCGNSKDLYLPKSCKNGTIIKDKGGTYSLEIMIRNSPVVYKELARVLMNDEQKALTRLLSLSLRHGVLPQYLVSQLKKANGDITAFSTAISRVLSKYIISYSFKDGEKTCPECNNESLFFSEGCIKCIDSGCGYSICS